MLLMNNYYKKSDYRQKSHIKYKSSASYLYQKFLGIDKRMRMNIVIGVSMVTIVVVTGLVLGMISLVQFGGNLIEEAFGKEEQEIFRSIQKDVEKITSPTSLKK